MNRLEEDYDDVEFVYLNANEEGKEAFAASQFRGHPSVLLMLPDGTEVWRYHGAPSITDMEKQILEALE